MKQNVWKIAAVFAIALCGCASIAAQPSATAVSPAAAFKEEYEALNGTENSSGKINRTITIPADNPFVMVSAEEVVQKAEAGESFYVLYSDPLCPWCRSVIEAACQSAKDNGIETIYSVDVWDDEGGEILRDKYQLKDGKIEKVSDGTEAYQKTLELFGNVLNDYTLSDDNDTSYAVGEKRIYLPNFINVRKGKAVKLLEGISNLQKVPREELTDAIKQDELKAFNDFFTVK